MKSKMESKTKIISLKSCPFCGGKAEFTEQRVLLMMNLWLAGLCVQVAARLLKLNLPMDRRLMLGIKGKTKNENMC